MVTLRAGDIYYVLTTVENSQNNKGNYDSRDLPIHTCIPNKRNPVLKNKRKNIDRRKGQPRKFVEESR